MVIFHCYVSSPEGMPSLSFPFPLFVSFAIGVHQVHQPCSMITRRTGRTNDRRFKPFSSWAKRQKCRPHTLQILRWSMGFLRIPPMNPAFSYGNPSFFTSFLWFSTDCWRSQNFTYEMSWWITCNRFLNLHTTSERPETQPSHMWLQPPLLWMIAPHVHVFEFLASHLFVSSLDAVTASEIGRPCDIGLTA